MGCWFGLVWCLALLRMPVCCCGDTRQRILPSTPPQSPPDPHPPTPPPNTPPNTHTNTGARLPEVPHQGGGLPGGEELPGQAGGHIQGPQPLRPHPARGPRCVFVLFVRVAWEQGRGQAKVSMHPSTQVQRRTPAYPHHPTTAHTPGTIPFHTPSPTTTIPFFSTSHTIHV